MLKCSGYRMSLNATYGHDHSTIPLFIPLNKDNCIQVQKESQVEQITLSRKKKKVRNIVIGYLRMYLGHLFLWAHRIECGQKKKTNRFLRIKVLPPRMCLYREVMHCNVLCPCIT